MADFNSVFSPSLLMNAMAKPTLKGLYHTQLNYNSYESELCTAYTMYTKMFCILFFSFRMTQH